MNRFYLTLWHGEGRTVARVMDGERAITDWITLDKATRKREALNLKEATRKEREN